MQSYERNGVVVDQCSECRGLFLDRGELEQLIAAESAWLGSEPVTAQRYGERERERYRPEYHDDRYGRRPSRKKRSFLENLFDD